MDRVVLIPMKSMTPQVDLRYLVVSEGDTTRVGATIDLRTDSQTRLKAHTSGCRSL